MDWVDQTHIPIKDPLMWPPNPLPAQNPLFLTDFKSEIHLAAPTIVFKAQHSSHNETENLRLTEDGEALRKSSAMAMEAA